ncbi:SDR family oxidoreductase [Rhodococcus sp. APC 3903]|uniref:SDR family NAD(P)-dependent oxidoreductase n=1 Tax=Rhodococcus sp. APC 3903 TaxID=3035193 RepID=UPI0033A48D69
MAATLGRYGRIDGVEACAGVVDPSPSHSVTYESIERLLDIHLMGTIRIAQAAYPHLKASDNGAIVAISSMGVHLGIPERLGYSAAKGGIEAVVKTLAFAEPSEIADVIAFLFSPAAGYFTGQAIITDGGMTIQDPWPK